jgi:DNA-binding GntR family transcriptional regulator
MDRESPAAISPVFGQISSVSLTERVTSALREAFFTGKLRPGDAIIERQVAREMNVGTPVVREALIALKHEGFVRRVSNKGSYVTQFTPEEVADLFRLRIELETLALQWARPRVTQSDLADLEALLKTLIDAGEEGNRSEFLRRDFEFHRRYWRASGNPFLADALERLMAPLFAFVVLVSDQPLTASMAREHGIFIDALRQIDEPQFTQTIRAALGSIASRWTTVPTRASSPRAPKIP